MSGVFHEYRLWEQPRAIGQTSPMANKPVPQGARTKLAVYLVADGGYGNQISNYGTSVRVTIPTASVNSNVYSQNSFDTRMFLPQECGPIPSEGLVTPYLPVRVQGAIDFRNIIGERVARQLVYLAGSCLYTYDAKTATVTAKSGGIFKKPGLFSMENFDGNVYFTNGGRPKVWGRKRGPIRRDRGPDSAPVHGDGRHVERGRYVGRRIVPYWVSVFEHPFGV